MGAFLIFDYLYCIKNLNLGIDATGSAGGLVEGTISYTGEESVPNKGKYDLEYYIKLTRDIANMGVHYLNFKYMAFLLNPRAATMLVSS